MTDAAQTANENATEEGAEMEDGSDAGSDVYMPGGITVKSTELPVDSGTESNNHPKEESNPSTTNEAKNEEANMSIDEAPSEAKPSVEDEKVEKKQESENVSKKTDTKENGPVDMVECPSSPESCLEIQMEDESAFPTSDKEKTINNQRKESEKEQEDMEERSNIFMNSDIFDKDKEDEKQDGGSAFAGSDDEHNMSDDFKIGLNQKSFEGDPFCPNKPRPFENIERNVYLIDK